MAKLPKYVWCKMDWKQAEARMLTLHAADSRMKESLLERDTHRFNYSIASAIAIDAVTRPQREVGKTMLYALIYAAFNPGAAIHALVKGGMTQAEAQQGVERILSYYEQIRDWVDRAMLQWFDDGGWVAYMMGMRKLISYPDYLRRDLKALSLSKDARIAVNTYGQNSIGLLLKFAMSKMVRDPFLQAHTKEYLQTFDSVACLVEVEHLERCLILLNNYSTWHLTINNLDFSMPIDPEWQISTKSYGETKNVNQFTLDMLKANLEPQTLAWTQPLTARPHRTVQLETVPQFDNPNNPFSVSHVPQAKYELPL